MRHVSGGGVSVNTLYILSYNLVSSVGLEHNNKFLWFIIIQATALTPRYIVVV